MSDNITPVNFGGAPFREMGEICEAMWSAIMEFEGCVPTVAVVGVRRLVEHKLLTEVHQEGEQFHFPTRPEPI